MKALFITDDFLIDPLGIGYLSSYLKAAGHRVEIVKVKTKQMSEPDYRDWIEPDKRRMLCYSVTTGKHGYYRDLNLQTRNANSVSVFGGPHPTFFPEFAKEPGVDVAVRGEGFDAIVDIANAIEAGKDIKGIPNTVVGDTVAELRPLKDKATLLHPDRELIYSFPENYHNPIKNVMCSFWCPHDCPYCYSDKYKQMYGLKSAEIRPVDDVLGEVAELRKYPLELIFFQDDIFPVYKSDWLEDFCTGYSEFGIPFHIQVRAEMLKEDVVSSLKDVGLHGVTFAIESGNDHLRQAMLGRRMSKDVIIKAADMLHRYGIRLRTENMIGIPGETWQTAMETLDLNRQCRPSLGWASLFQPYPGTKLGDQCVADGSFGGDFDALSGDFFSTYKLAVKGAKRYERLQKLFSMFVSIPGFRRLAGPLSILPLGGIYKRLYRWYKTRRYSKVLYNTTG